MFSSAIANLDWESWELIVNTESTLTVGSNVLVPEHLNPTTSSYVEYSDDFDLHNSYQPPLNQDVPMAGPTSAPIIECREELAEFQALSDAYIPEVTGTLVGDLQPIAVIQQQYENAEDVYVRKTRWLAIVYAFFRPIVGDGNCGWRALIFGYFEALCRCADPQRLRSEQRRMRDLDGLYERQGLGDFLEDWRDPTLDLLEHISLAASEPERLAVLVAALNHKYLSQNIIQYFRVLTSSWMKENPKQYEYFIEDGRSVQQYCADCIDPHVVEIEHLGIQAFLDVFIGGAGMVIDILYLDRSDSDHIEPLRLGPRTPNGQPMFTNPRPITLLYKIGHYDLLYKREDTSEAGNLPDIAASSMMNEFSTSTSMSADVPLDSLTVKLTPSLPPPEYVGPDAPNASMENKHYGVASVQGYAGDHWNGFESLGLLDPTDTASYICSDRGYHPFVQLHSNGHAAGLSNQTRLLSIQPVPEVLVDRTLDIPLIHSVDPSTDRTRFSAYQGSLINHPSTSSLGEEGLSKTGPMRVRQANVYNPPEMFHPHQENPGSDMLRRRGKESR